MEINIYVNVYININDANKERKKIKLQMYELESEEQIKNRLATILETPKKYILYIDELPKFGDEIKDEYHVFEIYNFIKQLAEKKIEIGMIEKNLLMKFAGVISIKDYMDIFIIYSKLIEDEMNEIEKDIIPGHETYQPLRLKNKFEEILKHDIVEYELEEEKKKVEVSEEEINDLYKVWQDRTNRKSNFKLEILMNKRKDEENIYKILSKVDAREIKYSNFQIEKNKISVKIELSKTILDIFNSIKLNDKIPYARCNDFFKILNGFVPESNWIKDSEMNTINMKYKVKNEWMDIMIKRDEKIENIYFIIFKYSRTLISEEEIISNVKECIEYTEEIKKEDIVSISLNGNYSVDNFSKPYNKYILADLIMNDDKNIFSKLLKINEAKQTEKKRFSILYYFEKNDNMRFELSQQGNIIKVTISDCSNLKRVEKFQIIFSKLLVLYINSYEEIFKIYKSLLNKEEFKMFEKSPVEVLVDDKKDKIPTIFMKTPGCQKKMNLIWH